MKKWFLTVLMILSLVLGINLKSYALLGVDVYGSVWMENPDGNLSYKGDTLSLKDLLGFDTEYQPFVTAKIETLGLIRFYASYSKLSFEGENTWNKQFKFADYTFNASVPFESSLKVDQMDLGIYFGIPFLHTATKVVTLGFSGIDIEFGAILKIFKFNGKIDQPQTGISKEADFTVPLPLLYAGAEIDIGALKIEGEGKAIKYKDNHFYEAMARVKMKIFGIPVTGPDVYIHAGYRYQDVEGEFSDVNVSFKVQGPFAGVGVNF